MHPPDPKKESPDSVDAEIRAEGFKSLPDRVNRYGKAKIRQLEVSNYMSEVMHSLDEVHLSPHLKALYSRTVVQLRECGNYLNFRHYPTVDKVRLHSASLCKKHLLCPLCAIRRGAKGVKAYLDRWEIIRAKNSRLRPFLVTLTVKDGPNLHERFHHLKTSLHELFKRKQRGRGCSLDCVKGAVWSYEMKRGKNSREWHPHVHMIALAEVAPNAHDLADEWHNITGDSYIVDVRPIQADENGNHINGFLEVFKYAVKFSDQPPADTVHCWLTLKGRNLIGSAGCFRGVEIPECLLDEPLDGLPYVEYFFRFIRGGYSLDVGAPATREYLRVQWPGQR